MSSAQGGLGLPSVSSARVHSCRNKNSLSDYSEWKGEGCDKALLIKGRPEDTGACAKSAGALQLHLLCCKRQAVP